MPLKISSSRMNIVKGDQGDNVLHGSNGDDILFGYGGKDVLYGGPGGSDTFVGGPGADRFVVEHTSGVQTASYATAATGVSVSLATGRGYKGDAAGDELQGITNLVGSAFGDALVGGPEANVLYGHAGSDALSGLGGNDVIVPGPGRDVVDGGDGVDTISYADSAKAVIVFLNQTDGKINGGEAKGEVILKVENVTGGKFPDILVGDGGANTLKGGGGGDVLKGFDGSDRLIGGGGHDLLWGGGSDDSFVIDQVSIATRDTAFDFSSGADKLLLSVDTYFKGLPRNVSWTSDTSRIFEASSSPKITQAKPTILYNTSTGIVYVDLDGSGTQHQLQEMILLDGAPQLAADDLVLF